MIEFSIKNKENWRILMTTRVVNLYKEKYDVYIGRAGKGRDGYFGNPFRLENEDQRSQILKQYASYFKKRLEEDLEFKGRILELKGKTLGCFCKPKKCHGDVIVAFLNLQK